MRKMIVIFLLILLVGDLFAQKFSVIGDLGYRPQFDRSPKIGLGAQFKYEIIHNICLAGDFMAYIPKDKYETRGLDIGFTVQYLLYAIPDKLVFYPLMGLVIVNHSFNSIPYRRKMTEPGFNFGAGSEFRITNRSFINAEFKYFLIKKEKPQWYDDYGLIRLGYGFRF